MFEVGLPCYLELNYAPINVKPVGEEAGHRARIWHFPKNCCKIPYPPGQKGEVKYNWNSPPREIICGQMFQKFKYPYPWDSKIIQMPSSPVPLGQSDQSNPCPMPCLLPPAGLTLIGALLVYVRDGTRHTMYYVCTGGLSWLMNQTRTIITISQLFPARWTKCLVW